MLEINKFSPPYIMPFLITDAGFSSWLGTCRRGENYYYTTSSSYVVYVMGPIFEIVPW